MTRKQLALVHIAKARLGVPDDEYREILRDHCGVETSKDLDAEGFGLLMALFRQWGFLSDWEKANFGDRPGMATARQVAFIRHLWDEYTAGQGSDAQLGTWLDKHFGVSALRFLDAAGAGKAITALKAMAARKRAGAEADH